MFVRRRSCLLGGDWIWGQCDSSTLCTLAVVLEKGGNS